jgi:hypothetical protein
MNFKDVVIAALKSTVKCEGSAENETPDLPLIIKLIPKIEAVEYKNFKSISDVISIAEFQEIAMALADYYSYAGIEEANAIILEFAKLHCPELYNDLFNDNYVLKYMRA